MKAMTRRLQRLEARSATVNAVWSHSILIHFVNMQCVATSTLLLQSGKPDVRTHFPDDASTSNSNPSANQL